LVEAVSSSISSTDSRAIPKPTGSLRTDFIFFLLAVDSSASRLLTGSSSSARDISGLVLSLAGLLLFDSLAGGGESG
jgi:hypothetical protein